MQVVKQDLEIYRDNDKDVIFELQDGAGDPYDSTDVSFFVSVFARPDGRETSRILRRELVPLAGPTTELVWEVSAERSVMLHSQDALYYRLDRALSDGKRRTWVTGSLRLRRAPSTLGDDSGAYVLQINDGDEVVVVAVDDTSGARLASELARDAAIAAQAAAEDARDEALVTNVGVLAGRVAALESVTISGLTSNVTVAEFGTSVTPTLTWDLVGTAEVSSLTVNGSPLALDAEAWTAPSPITADQTYTIAVTTTNGGADSAAVSVDFRHRAFWGASASSSLNSAGVIALAGSQLATSRALSKTVVAAAQYVYVAYPVEFGAPTGYRLFGFDETATVETVSVTTAAGYVGDYYVLRSPLPLSASVPVEVS